MPVVFIGSGLLGTALLCTECDTEFYVKSRQSTARHPTYDSLAAWIEMSPCLRDPDFPAKLRACPNAGKTFRLPVAEEVKE